MRVAALLAYVRLTAGGTVPLETGKTVPAEADPAHVLELLGKGVLELEEGESAPTLPTELGDVDAGGPANVDERVVTEPVPQTAKKSGPKPGPQGGSQA